MTNLTETEAGTSSVKALVLHLLTEHGDLTDEQIGDLVRRRMPRVDDATPRKRRTDLVRDGLVVDSGIRRLTRAERASIVWHAIGDGELPIAIPVDPKLELAPVATSIASELWRSWGLPMRGLEHSFAQTVEAVTAGLMAREATS